LLAAKGRDCFKVSCAFSRGTPEQTRHKYADAFTLWLLPQARRGAAAGGRRWARAAAVRDHRRHRRRDAGLRSGRFEAGELCGWCLLSSSFLAERTLNPKKHHRDHRRRDTGLGSGRPPAGGCRALATSFLAAQVPGLDSCNSACAAGEMPAPFATLHQSGTGMQDACMAP